MNIYDAIIPAQSLGGFKLKDNIKVYSDIIEEYELNGKLKFFQTNAYSCRYAFYEVPVEVNVDITTGLIYKISALSGYQGDFNSIKIGMPIRKVLDLKLGFYYDECEEAFFSKKIQGISLEVSEDDPPLEEVEGMNIQYISVYDPSIFIV